MGGSVEKPTDITAHSASDLHDNEIRTLRELLGRYVAHWT